MRFGGKRSNSFSILMFSLHQLVLFAFSFCLSFLRKYLFVYSISDIGL